MWYIAKNYSANVAILKDLKLSKALKTMRCSKISPFC